MTTPALTFLYQDDSLVVVDKPAGLAVHRGWAPERDVLVERLRRQLGRPVHAGHRLDRGTSGALAVALDPEAAAALGLAFAEGRVHKTYRALVRGTPADEGLIDHPLRSGDELDGPHVPAQTRVRRLEVFGRYSLVEAEPLTGRLHQIRRHLKHISCPIIGDVRYGKGEHNRLFRARYQLHRPFLHAMRLEFAHPVTGVHLVIDSPLAIELENTLTLLRADPP